MAETQKLTLAQKLVEVYKKVDHIEKRGVNSAQNYKYVKASDLAHAIRNALSELGIYAQVVFDSKPPYTYTTKSGTVMNMVDVRCDITFIDADDLNAPPFRTSGLGSGSDTGDKAIYKAQTGAAKYALRNAFLVPDDSDPENEEAEPEKSVPKQAKASAPTKAAQVPKAEIPSEPLGKPAAQPGETESPNPVSSGVVSGIIHMGANDALPTEEQTQSIRNRYSLLGKDLGDAGLKPSTGKPIGRKLTLYLLHRTGMSDAEKVTYGQWQKFFEECAAYKDGKDGFKSLVEKINTIVEEKK